MTMNQSLALRRLLTVLAASAAATIFDWLGLPNVGWPMAVFILLSLGFVRGPGEHPVETTGASQTDLEIMLSDLEKSWQEKGQ